MEVSKACTLASLFTRVNITQHTDLFLVSLFVYHSALRIAPNQHAIHLLLRYDGSVQVRMGAPDTL